MAEKKIIARHRAYANLTDFGHQYRNTADRALAVGVTFPPEQVDPVMKIIQQPDPLTGFPKKDLTLLFAADTNPEIRDYIQRYIIHPLPSQGGTSDPDAAIDMLRRKDETDAQYIERLSGEIKSFNESVNMFNSEGADD